MDLKIKPLYDDTQIPVRNNSGDSGADVFAHNLKRQYVNGAIKETRIDGGELPVHIRPRERVLIGTGIAATYGKGYEILVRPRSGNPLKQGLIIANSPGTIDEPYRGEFGVIIINNSQATQTIEKGDRIAQIAVSPVVIPNIVVVKELDETERGDKGFGDSGLK